MQVARRFVVQRYPFDAVSGFESASRPRRNGKAAPELISRFRRDYAVHRLDDRDELGLFRTMDLALLPEAPRTLLKGSNGAEKVDSAEFWPVHLREIELAVSALPEQKAGQTDLPTCADDEVEVR
jgi:hypothetical protein